MERYCSHRIRHAFLFSPDPPENIHCSAGAATEPTHTEEELGRLALTTEKKEELVTGPGGTLSQFPCCLLSLERGLRHPKLLC